MMYFESNEARKEYILKEAEKIRTAAGIIKDIKPIVRQFDGKVYNKRFCEAVEALRSDSLWISAGINYGFFYIRTYPARCYSEDIYILSTRAATAGEEREAFTDSKRIKADAMIDILNNKYGELMRKAYIFEEQARTLDQTMDQIDQLKMIYKKLWDDIPGELHEVYNIKRI